MRAISSAFCAEVPTGSGRVSVTLSRVTAVYLAKTCPIPDKAAAIYEILNIQMTNWLVSQVWLAGEHLIHNH
jgi:hypothetical protein